jgi:YVTN family beta-propeller protein
VGLVGVVGAVGVASYGADGGTNAAVAGASPPEAEGAAAKAGGGDRRSARATRPSSSLRLRRVRRIGGRITPKSVVASDAGLFFAQNMMYSHSVTVYDRSARLVKTIPDRVRLARLGQRGHRGVHRGAPVEAAFSSDGRFAYVSNYRMSGRGFDRPGHDVCSPSRGFDRSFLYRIPVSSLAVDRAIRVGSVPKYVAVTPDDRLVLATNWCSWDLSVVDARRGRRVRTVGLGPYPRGIAVDPSSRFAYIAVMGSSDVAKVDLEDFSVSWMRGVGAGPRDLVLGPGGRRLYVTLNNGGAVAKVDPRRKRALEIVRTGRAPRSMAISSDGRSLYVVNYGSHTVSKIRTRDMRVLQRVRVDPGPIGITHDAATGQVWVACYSGSILVFEDA